MAVYSGGWLNGSDRVDEGRDEMLWSFLLSFRGALAGMLKENLAGLYLYGSIALRDYDERHSDIDFLCVLNHPMSEREIEQVQAWHEQVAIDPYGGRLDGQYIVYADVGKAQTAIDPYPAVCVGTFHSSTHWDINAVTWWILKTRGVALFGSEVQHLPIAVTWADVESAMESNLRYYWPRRLSQPEDFDTVNDCVDAILTLCRIIHTLTFRTIESKCISAGLVCNLLPKEWCTLVNGAVEIRRSHASMQVPADQLLRDRAQAFIRYAIEFCTKRYLSGR